MTTNQQVKEAKGTRRLEVKSKGRQVFKSFLEKARAFWQAVLVIKTVLQQILQMAGELSFRIDSMLQAGQVEGDEFKSLCERLTELRQAKEAWYQVAAGNVKFRFGVDLAKIDYMAVDIDKILQSDQLMMAGCRKAIAKTRGRKPGMASRSSMVGANVIAVRGEKEVQAQVLQSGDKIVLKGKKVTQSKQRQKKVNAPVDLSRLCGMPGLNVKEAPGNKKEIEKMKKEAHVRLPKKKGGQKSASKKK